MPNLRDSTPYSEVQKGGGATYWFSFADRYANEASNPGAVSAEVVSCGGTATLTNQTDDGAGNWSGFLTGDTAGLVRVVVSGTSSDIANPYKSVFEVRVIDPSKC